MHGGSNCNCKSLLVQVSADSPELAGSAREQASQEQDHVDHAGAAGRHERRRRVRERRPARAAAGGVDAAAAGGRRDADDRRGGRRVQDLLRRGAGDHRHPPRLGHVPAQHAPAVAGEGPGGGPPRILRRRRRRRRRPQHRRPRQIKTGTYIRTSLSTCDASDRDIYPNIPTCTCSSTWFCSRR